jgi:hypothetical protein
MPIPVDDITTLQNYLAGVVQRADHHGENVRHVVFPLIGALVLFKSPLRNIKVYAREGSTGNVLWTYIRDTQYAFSYEHQSDSIVLKVGTTQGQVLAHFTNATTIPEILRVFEAL